MSKLTFAERVSLILHPFVMAVVLTLISSVAEGGLLYSVGSVLLVLLLVLLPLTAFIRYKVKNRKWENIDASNKWERPSFYITAIGLMLMLVILLTVFSIFAFLLKGLLSVLILLVLHYLLNRYIKASLHTSFITFAAVASYSFYPAAGYILAALIPILVWARLTLKRHTVIEIAAGLLTGAAAGTLTYIF